MEISGGREGKIERNNQREGETETERERQRGGLLTVMTTVACTRSEVSLERLVQFIGVVLFYLAWAFPSFLPSPLPLSRRAAAVSEELHGGGVCPRGFCPSFVSPSNYDLPHDYEPYVNICAFPPLPSLHRSTDSIVSPSLSLALSLSSFPSPSLSLCLSLPVTAARTSFCAPWGCKCIRDDGRVLPE